MRSMICVHKRFERMWPFAANYWYDRRRSEGACDLYGAEDAGVRVPQLVADPGAVVRLALLGFPAEERDLEPFTSLQERYYDYRRDLPATGIEAATRRGVTFVPHRPDPYWGQSVAEFASVREYGPWQHRRPLRLMVPLHGSWGGRLGSVRLAGAPSPSQGLIVATASWIWCVTLRSSRQCYRPRTRRFTSSPGRSSMRCRRVAWWCR